MRKKILIPTDFSQNAFNAILYAFELFADEECTFHICHTYYIVASKGIPTFPVPDEIQYRAIHDGIVSKLKTLEEKVGALPKNEKHQLHFASVYGFLTDVLKEKVNKENMEKVRECPVMAIPANVVQNVHSEIVFPTSFDGKYNWEDLEGLKQIAIMTKAPIRIVHVGDISDLGYKQLDNKKRLEEHFIPVEISFHWLDNVDLLEGLLLFVKQRNSTMISFVNRKHWFFGTIFSNPLIKNLGIHSTVPLLALHDH